MEEMTGATLTEADLTRLFLEIDVDKSGTITPNLVRL
jgi:hypothetical protein